jgi:hypothetical protein
VAAVLFVLRGTGDVLAQQVPDDAMMYATAYLDPSATQKINLNSLLDKFPAWDSEQFSGQLDDTLSQAFSGSEMSWEEDVQPWIGTQVGLVVLPPQDTGADPGAAFLLATSDGGASEDALTKAEGTDDSMTWETSEYEGVTLHVGTSDVTGFTGDIASGAGWAVTDDVVVITDGEDSLKAVVDAKYGSLSGNDGYNRTVDALPSDRLGLAFINVPVFADAVERASGMQSALALGVGPNPFDQLKAIQGMGMSLAAEPDGFAVRTAVAMDPDESSTGQVEPHRSAVLDWAPADTYGLFAASGIKDGFKQLADAPGMGELGLLGSFDGLGDDFGVVVNPNPGSDAAGGAILVEVEDATSVKTLMDRLAMLVEQGMAAQPILPEGTDFGVSPLSLHQDAMGWRTETYEGVEITYLAVPSYAQGEGLVPAYAVTDEMAFVATSPEEIHALIDANKGENVTSSDNFQTAIAHGDIENGGMAYFDLESIIATAAEADPYSGEEMKRQLEPLKAMVMTGSDSDGVGIADMFILID